MFIVGKTYQHDIYRGNRPDVSPQRITILFVGESYTIGKYQEGSKSELWIDNFDFEDWEEVVPKESITIGYINIYKSLDTGKLRAGKLHEKKGDADLLVSESTLEKLIHTLKVEYQEE